MLNSWIFNKRIPIAWREFCNLWITILEKSILRKLRLEVLDSCVFPVLLYGIQNWAVTSKTKTALQVCQRKMKRNILEHDFERGTSTLSNLLKTMERVTNMQWRWGGFLAPNTSNKIGASVLDMGLDGKRRQGRQRTRWTDMFSADIGI